MSNRNHALSNKEARALEEDELLFALSRVFEASNSRPPSAEETLVLQVQPKAAPLSIREPASFESTVPYL